MLRDLNLGKCKLKLIVEKKIKSSNNFFLILMLLLFTAYSIQAKESQEEWEYNQKAKIIEYLAGEVRWPQGVIANNTVNVCLLGQFPTNSINALNGKSIKGRMIKIKSPNDLKQVDRSCNMLVIAKSEQQNLSKIIRQFLNQPVLLLGDMEDFAKDGGSMNFIALNEVIAITVNIDSLKASNLIYDLKKFDKITVIPEKSDLNE